MASQVSGLIGSAWFPALLVAGAAVLALIALMSNAPGEWGRGALTAYVAVVAALIAGICAAALGGWVLAVAGLGVLAMIIGGPWGLLIAAVGAAVLTVAQYLSGEAPVPTYAALSLCGLSLIAALRALLI